MVRQAGADRARRRRVLATGLGLALGPGLGAVADGAGLGVQRGRVLVFPRDHGAHPETRIEWWYVTGWLADGKATQGAPPFGFQITFFRHRTGFGGAGRLAPQQLLIGHAAVTDVEGRRHAHASRIARWSGDPAAHGARALLATADVRVGGWGLAREDDGRWRLQAEDGGRLRLELRLRPTQPLLLQGEAGHSRKGPEPQQASHYVSEPQLAVQGRLAIEGRAIDGQGRAWLDHEWSDEVLPPQAVGWDWVGFNLDDGRALTAFRLRRADGSAIWAGGSLRGPQDAAARSFGPDEVTFEPTRRWRSPATGGDYPVGWRLRTPAGHWQLEALLDAQELDTRATTGTVYWEGLAQLRDEAGRRLGLGYLEMTGYVGRLAI